MSRAPYHRDIDLGDDPVTVNEQKLQHSSNVAANDAFVLAMARAVQRGKEKAVPGTFVETSEPIYHKRYYATAPRSHCGSPSAMCIESTGQQDGAAVMK